MHLTRSFQRAVIVMASAGLAACSDSSTAPSLNPPVTFDALAALARVNPVAAVFDQPVFRSFEGALTFVEPFFRSSIAASVMVPRPGIAPALTRSVAPVASITARDVPDSLKGKTLVYDIATARYVIDPAADGAPANGVRFVLCAWDAATISPAIPLTPIGFIDITPLTAAGVTPVLVELTIARVAPALVVTDVVVIHGADDGVNVFGITGIATDGRTTVDVDVDGTEGGGDGQHHLVYNTSLTASSLGVSDIEQLVYDQASASQSGRLQLRYAGHTLIDESVATGADLSFDGNLYAKILFSQGSSAAPRYVKPDGTALTTQEMADLDALLNRVVATDFLWVNLAFP